MTHKIMHLGAIIALAMGGLGSISPAAAHERGHGHYRDYQAIDDNDYGWCDRESDHRFDDRGYESRRTYYGNRSDRPSHRKCGKGTTGLILGGVVGSLLGRAVAGREGDRTAGLIIGGGAGALAGRAIDKSDDRCRRR